MCARGKVNACGMWCVTKQKGCVTKQKGARASLGRGFRAVVRRLDHALQGDKNKKCHVEGTSEGGG